jgi:hypothetical protein
MGAGTDTDLAVAFFAGGRDHRGRTLDEILRFSDDDLERVHDYIQWLFPTVQPSAVNPRAPLVTRATVEAFASRSELRERLHLAFERMLSFYGLRRVPGPGGTLRIEIDESRFGDRARVWLLPGNHNHLRLTRIMESLAVLGSSTEARALRDCLTRDIYDGPGRNLITAETYEYWIAAAKD